MNSRLGINVSFLRKPATGIGQVAFNFLKTLNESSQNFKYYLYAEKDIDLKLNKNFIKRVFLPPYQRDDLIRKIWWEKFCLPKKVRRDECQTFISLYQCPTILSKNIKHTMIVHDIIPKLFPEYLNNWRKKIYWRLTERAIKKANKIIAISEHTKEDLIKYLQISSEKIEVKYLDVSDIYKKEVNENESARVLQKYNLTKGYIYFGGGLEKRKNVKVLLKAYRLLLDFKFPIPKLVISGKLMPELAPLVTDVEKLVRKFGLEDKVRLLDFVPQKYLPALYKNASVFIYPSLYEGFGLPVLEAMNCGTPVICANVSSLPEIGESAVKYFNPKSEKDLVKKMKEFLQDDSLCLNFSKKGKIQARKFSWKKFLV